MTEESLFIARVDEDRCVGCGFCQGPLYCPSLQGCIGCGLCAAGCPHQARKMGPDEGSRAAVSITVNSQPLSVPERVTVKRALELAELSFGAAWGEGDVPGPRRTGGCYSYLVLADGEAVRAYASPVRNGMAIQITLPADHVPRRIIHGPQGHAVGGKATP